MSFRSVVATVYHSTIGFVSDEIRNAYALRLMSQPTILTSEGTLDRMITEKVSIGRFGDGEMAYMLGDGIPFQVYDRSLACKLRLVLQSTTPGFLVCVPRYLTRRSGGSEWVMKYLRGHRYTWYKLMSGEIVYGDANISRFYLAKQNKAMTKTYLVLLRKVWNNRDVVFIEGEESRLGVGNDLFCGASSIRRILCPKVNAFSRYIDILNFVRANVEKSALLILALGPTATVMAHDLHLLGYQALDLGHIDIEYEWYLMGATEKIAVKGKYVNEAEGGITVDPVLDEEYERQIIMRCL